MKNLISRIGVFVLFTTGMSLPAALPAAAQAHSTSDTGALVSPEGLLNPDGTVKLDGRLSGSVDLSGWNVSIDSELGPVFTPEHSTDPNLLQTASPGQWAALSYGGGDLNNNVHALTMLGSDLIVGGNFNDAANIAEADYVAGWDGSNWYALGSNGYGSGVLNSTVNALLVVGTDLYAGGYFGNITDGGNYMPTADYVAKWDGSNWSGLSNNGAGNGSLNGGVLDLATLAGDLYVGGSFTNVNNGGVTLGAADYVAMWDGSDWSALGSNGASNGSIGLHVHALEFVGTDLYAGGDFTNVNNGGASLGAADYVAMWDGSDWSALGSDGAAGGSLNSSVYALAAFGTEVFVGGSFTNVNNGGSALSAADYIAKWNGSAWSAVGSGNGGNGSLNSSLYDLWVDGTDVYAGGSFYGLYNGAVYVAEAAEVAVFDTVGGLWSALGDGGTGYPALTGGVQALAMDGTTLYAGGWFQSLNNGGTFYSQARGIAQWDGTDWSPMGSYQGSFREDIYTMAVSGSNLYVGGYFSNLVNAGVPIYEADMIARWDGSDWHGVGSNGFGDGVMNNSVNVILVDGSDVYAGGWFSDVYDDDGTTLPEADYLARFDGSNWHALGSDGAGGGSLNSAVHAMAMIGSDLYVGGEFANVNDGGSVIDEADRVAMWDGTNWHALGSNGAGNGALDNNDYIFTMATIGTDLYIGGYFEDVMDGATPLNAADFVAKWDGSNWSALGDDGSGGASLNSTVNDLVAIGTDLYVGGFFYTVNNYGTTVGEARYMAKWDGSNWSGLGGDGFGNGPFNNGVYDLAVRGSELYAAGSFINVNNGGVLDDRADLVARWDGTTWHALGSDGAGDGSISEPGSAYVSVLAVSATDAYVAGYFWNVNNGGTPVDYADYLAAYGLRPYAEPADFDGNAASDVVLYRGGAWLFFDYATATPAGSAWTGNPGGSCVPAPMDYDGDGTKDLSQLCGGAWHFYDDDGTYNKGIWVGNVAGQKPVPADYNGDGTDDVKLFRSGAWVAYDFTTGLYDGANSVWTGNPGGIGVPSPMDYDGDDFDEPTILSGGAWHFYNDNGSYNKGIWVGNVAGQLAVPGDYYDYGTDDVWLFRGGAWLHFDFDTGLYDAAGSVWTGAPPPPAGGGATKPAPIDYDGDGSLDFTVFAGGPWHFYNDNGSYNKGIWVGKNVVDKPISRRPLP